MDVTSPWRAAAAIEPARFAGVRRQAIFECCKWDPQVEDVATLAPYPLVLRRETWRELASAAEALTAETLAAEAELLGRLELHKELGLPRPIRSALRHAVHQGAAGGAARVMRFDFHATPEGWRISEVNSDVPGGFNEASGFTRLMASHFPGTELAGRSRRPARGGHRRHGLRGIDRGPGPCHRVHRRSSGHGLPRPGARGARAAAGPDRTRSPALGGRAAPSSPATPSPGRSDFLVRFFPAEWLPNLPKPCGWKNFFGGCRTPASNPAYALLTQSKRFPLVWDRLVTGLPTWRRLLPETRDPREVGWRRDEGWVLKPALGRVGRLDRRGRSDRRDRSGR